LARRGRKRNLNREDEYWELILAGIGPIAAAKRVGIGRATGHRWRSQRGGIAPLRLAEADRHERYLSLIERERIALFRREGFSIREISRRLGRSPSTISRELRRNMREHDRGQCDAVLAHARAREKARRARTGRIGQDLQLRDLVQDKLKLDWSPEQISYWLRDAHPQKRSVARMPRNDLPSPVLARKQWIDPEIDTASKNWPATAQASTAPRRTRPTLHRTGDLDRPPPPGRERQVPVRRLGRRPHHRHAHPLGDRHPGRPQERLRRPPPPPRRAHLD